MSPQEIWIALKKDKQSSDQSMFEEESEGTSMYQATVKSQNILAKEGAKTVIEVELEFSEPVSRERLDVGQSIAVYPRNSNADV